MGSGLQQRSPGPEPMHGAFLEAFLLILSLRLSSRSSKHWQRQGSVSAQQSPAPAGLAGRAALLLVPEMLSRRSGNRQGAGTRTQESQHPQILTSSSNKGPFVLPGCLPEGTFPSQGQERRRGWCVEWHPTLATDVHFLPSRLLNPTAQGDRPQSIPWAGRGVSCGESALTSHTPAPSPGLRSLDPRPDQQGRWEPASCPGNRTGNEQRSSCSDTLSSP